MKAVEGCRTDEKRFDYQICKKKVVVNQMTDEVRRIHGIHCCWLCGDRCDKRNGKIYHCNHTANG